jgi:hypothetical protein
MTEQLMKSDLSGGDLAKDLIWGTKAIAAEIGRSERQAYHMLASGNLPARLVGGRWMASREKLRRHLLGDA